MSANLVQLSLGSDNKEAVSQLQRLLNENGANLGVDGIFGVKTDAAVRQYQQQNGLDPDGIVGPKTWNLLLKDDEPVTMPTSVEEAKAAWEEHVSNAPGDFVFGDQALMDRAQQAIQNRTPFAYDPDADALYQHYRNSYTAQGRRAMEDTMGLAMASTGGFGNSYAQTVGQQTYQDYLEKLGDVSQDLYALAYEKYADETDRLQGDYTAWEKRREEAWDAYQAQLKSHAGTEQELYDRYQDALSRRDKAYTQLVALIKLGHVPTDEELAAAGMTREMAIAIAEGS